MLVKASSSFRAGQDGLGVGVDAAAADEATTEGRLAERLAALTELN